MDQFLYLSWMVGGFLAFIAIVAFVYRRGAMLKYQEIAKTPLKND